MLLLLSIKPIAQICMLNYSCPNLKMIFFRKCRVNLDIFFWYVGLLYCFSSTLCKAASSTLLKAYFLNKYIYCEHLGENLILHLYFRFAVRSLKHIDVVGTPYSFLCTYYYCTIAFQSFT